MKRTLSMVFFATFLIISNLCALDHKHYHKAFFGKVNEVNICYIYMPKNLSTYLRKCFYRHPKMYPYKKIAKAHGSFIKVICVRDPLYRAISCYNEVMKLRRDSPKDKTVESQFWKTRENIRKSFSLFLDEIENNFYDPHINHQHLALSRIGLTLADIDFVILQSKAAEDLKTFNRKYPIPMKPAERNRTPSKTKLILKRYIQEDSGIREKIRKLWEKDFEFYEEAKKRRLEILKNF